MSCIARLGRTAPWSLAWSTRCGCVTQHQAGSAAAAAAAALLGQQHWQQQHRALCHQAGSSDVSAANPTAQAADTHQHPSSHETALPPADSSVHNSLHNNRSTAAAPDPAHQSAASSSVSSHGASHSLAKAAAAGTASNGNSPSSSSSSLAQASYERLARLSSAVNRLTGYESIDKLKGSVGSANQQLQDVKGALAAAKAEYDECLARQTQLHREVTALLQRKSSWVPADVARFTQLYAAEHETETAVASSKARYSHLGDEAERLQLALVDLIRERYQQEQLWSDNIRRASTWWTWGLMGLHFASFVTVYTVLEPRKRAALQAAVADMLSTHMQHLDGRLMQLAPAGAAAAADSAEAAADQQQQQRQTTVSAGAKVPGNSKQPQEELEQQQDLQQQVLQELQLVRQQLAELQQATPAAVSAAGAEQQPAHGRWQVPGSGWAAGQLAAAGRSAQALWQHSRLKAEQVLGQLTAHRLQSEQQLAEGAQTAADAAQVPAAPAAPVAEATSVAAAQRQSSSSEGNGITKTAVAASAYHPKTDGSEATEQRPAAVQRASLLQQLKSSSSVLEVTKGQLAGVAAAAAAAGAGLAAVVVALLKGAGGAAAGGGSR